MEKVRQNYPKVEIIVINMVPRLSSEKFQAYIEGIGLKEAIYLQDVGGKAARSFNVRRPATTIILDSKGVETFRDQSTTPYEDFEVVLEP